MFVFFHFQRCFKVLIDKKFLTLRIVFRDGFAIKKIKKMITKIICTHVCHINKIDIFIRNQFLKILCVPTVWAGTALDTLIS